MDSNKLNDWVQILATVGVILSLIFVGIQIQQSREIAIADIYQQRTALLMQQISMTVTPEGVVAARKKLASGEELESSERGALYLITSSRMAYWENNHFQFQMGLLDEEQWNASKNNIRSIAANSPIFRYAWNIERSQVRKSFADEVDKILAEEGIAVDE